MLRFFCDCNCDFLTQVKIAVIFWARGLCLAVSSRRPWAMSICVCLPCARLCYLTVRLGDRSLFQSSVGDRPGHCFWVLGLCSVSCPCLRLWGRFCQQGLSFSASVLTSPGDDSRNCMGPSPRLSDGWQCLAFASWNQPSPCMFGYIWPFTPWPFVRLFIVLLETVFGAFCGSMGFHLSIES